MRLVDSVGSSSSTTIISANFASLLHTVRPPIYGQISLYICFALRGNGDSSPVRHSLVSVQSVIAYQANTGIERSRIAHQLLSG